MKSVSGAPAKRHVRRASRESSSSFFSFAGEGEGEGEKKLASECVIRPSLELEAVVNVQLPVTEPQPELELAMSHSDLVTPAKNGRLPMVPILESDLDVATYLAEVRLPAQ
jgi:hypothetical protein